VTQLVPGLAVIGSRRASPYGLSCAKRFASLAARAGVTVISGGATGCDGEAHRAALAAGGSTVAVLGCGPDVDYPHSEARTLARVRESGCVISESPPGQQPRRWAFPRRNRIIAGLARAVLVVEAGLPSGTFSTADHALDADRLVLAVPGSIFSAGSEGTNRLIRDGAIPIADDEDLLQALGVLEQRIASGGASAAHGRDVDPILAFLAVRPCTPAELAEGLGMPLRQALKSLGRLEAQGLVERDPAGGYGPSQQAFERGARGVS
jgi:DNA processing protein